MSDFAGGRVPTTVAAAFSVRTPSTMRTIQLERIVRHAVVVGDDDGGGPRSCSSDRISSMTCSPRWVWRRRRGRFCRSGRGRVDRRAMAASATVRRRRYALLAGADLLRSRRWSVGYVCPAHRALLGLKSGPRSGSPARQHASATDSPSAPPSRANRTGHVARHQGRYAAIGAKISCIRIGARLRIDRRLTLVSRRIPLNLPRRVPYAQEAHHRYRRRRSRRRLVRWRRQRRSRDGRCVAANLSALPGTVKSEVAKSSPGALADVIQLHLDGELDLLGVCSD